jgi:hypothetical protein
MVLMGAPAMDVLLSAGVSTAKVHRQLAVELAVRKLL